ncbi:unnamed protein product [Haemonchus placei]|uniref:COesterase domain-containing protein n=1 Tax=Haemonchus placei TaxID=6290 RepID=A0A0N4VXT9_HAEPC|nr:unnamed protein product [Haemonchus placei]
MFDVFALGEFEIDETEQIVADVIQQSFINFAKTGVPLNQHAPWRDVGTSTNLRHLAISPEPHMEQGFYDGTRLTNLTMNYVQITISSEQWPSFT